MRLQGNTAGFIIKISILLCNVRLGQKKFLRPLQRYSPVFVNHYALSSLSILYGISAEKKREIFEKLLKNQINHVIVVAYNDGLENLGISVLFKLFCKAVDEPLF